jgi:hypothetical protein
MQTIALPCGAVFSGDRTDRRDPLLGREPQLMLQLQPILADCIAHGIRVAVRIVAMASER